MYKNDSNAVITISNDNIIVSNTSVTNPFVVYDLGEISQYQGKTITFSLEENSGYDDTRFVNCNAYGLNRTEIGSKLGSGTSITYTVSGTYNQTHLAIRLYARGSIGDTYTFKKPMVEISSSPTSYIAHAEQNFTLNLGSLELCKIVTYADYIYHKWDGNWYKVANVGKRNITDLSWQIGGGRLYSSTVSSLILKESTSSIYTPNILCNCYYKMTASDWYNKRKDGISVGVSGYGSAGDILIYDNDYDNTTDFINAMTNNYIMFILETPTETQITDATLISQLNAIEEANGYTGTTYITVTNSNDLAIVPSYKYNFVTPAPSPERPSTVEVVTGENTITIANSDNSESQTYTLTLPSGMELAKIGNYKDYIYRSNGNWYKKETIGKTTDTAGSTSKTIDDMVSDGGIFSYYGGTLSGKTITYDSNIPSTNTIYYPKATATDVQITDDTLLTQLEAIHNAYVYANQTNISQTNADLPFYLEIVAEVEE